MKKDTEKADQLRSMMQAWEAEQPGRCKKAHESRQKFLEARAIKEEKVAEDELNSTSTLDSIPASAPRPNLGPVKIWQMDLTPFTMSVNWAVLGLCSVGMPFCGKCVVVEKP